MRLGRRAGQAVPNYLKGYEKLYQTDPHQAALAWFNDAQFGLFMHYGLYSILGRGEWVQFRSKPPIPIPEYEKLTERFRPDKFDADFITDMALEAGMKYVNLTSKHHDGFCLFDTGKGKWNSMAVARRDLCAELAEQCQKKGLGCFFYYSLLVDWHHPYFYPRKYLQYARPDYKTKPEQYKFEKDEDFQKYLDDATGHIRALLTNYGPISGIWFDPVLGYYGRPEPVPDGRHLRDDPQAATAMPHQCQAGHYRNRGFRRSRRQIATFHRRGNRVSIAAKRPVISQQKRGL